MDDSRPHRVPHLPAEARSYVFTPRHRECIVSARGEALTTCPLVLVRTLERRAWYRESGRVFFANARPPRLVLADRGFPILKRRSNIRSARRDESAR
jgi:hypothetical protein